MAEPINYDEIIERLAALTQQGKLGWSTVFSQNAYVCVLHQGTYTFKIEKTEADTGHAMVTFAMTDQENNEIFRVSTESWNELGRKLDSLHEDARRSALHVEDKINQVKDILSHI